MLWLSILLTILIISAIVFLIFLYRKKKCAESEIGICTKLKFKGKHIRLKRFFAILLIILIGAWILLGSGYIANHIAYIRPVSGYWEWQESNGQKYLYVEADNSYDLGYHTGVAMASDIVKMKLVLNAFALFMGSNIWEMEQVSNQYIEYIPEWYIQELQGMADGASFSSGTWISFTDTLVQAVFIEAMYGRIIPLHENPIEPHQVGCTDFGAVNNNGSITIGQTWDFSILFSWTHQFVLHKLPGKPLVFTYRMGACPALPLGKNEYGLTLVMNLVMTDAIAPIMTPTFVYIREGLENNVTAEDLCKTLLPDNKSSYSHNFLMADNDTLIAVQCLPENVTKKVNPPTIVQSNTYSDLYWQQYLVHPEYSKQRQQYAEIQIASNYTDGDLTEQELLAMMGDNPIICRPFQGLTESFTIAFMTKTHFGIGTVNDLIGVIPI